MKNSASLCGIKPGWTDKTGSPDRRDVVAASLPRACGDEEDVPRISTGGVILMRPPIVPPPDKRRAERAFTGTALMQVRYANRILVDPVRTDGLYEVVDDFVAVTEPTPIVIRLRVRLRPVEVLHVFKPETFNRP